MTVIDLIRANYQRPVRKFYIKRKSTAGVFETNWTRIDNYLNQNRVLKWGECTLKIDDESGRIGAFDTSGITLQCDNSDGLFCIETDDRSIWYGYLNRKNTKVKIEAGYLDESGVETGMATVFEGTIDKVQVGDDQIAKIQCLSYQAILTKYDISDLGLTGKKSFNTVITAIMNQTKITDYIPYVAPDVGVNADITDTSLLTGTYWENLKAIAYKSNTVVVVYGSIFKFLERTVAGASVMTLYGRGSANNDIIKINAYDDEGASRVRVHWLVSDTNVEARSTDPQLLLKYLDEPEIITLDDIDTTPQKQAIVDALLAEWQKPKPTIDFDTRFFINQLNPLDIFDMQIKGYVVPFVGGIIWDSWKWDDGSLWARTLGTATIDSTKQWKVLSIKRDLENWKNTVKAEQIPL
jgi:hypothetical protein